MRNCGLRNYKWVSLHLKSCTINYSSIAYPCLPPLNRRNHRHKLATLLQLPPLTSNPISYYQKIHARIVLSGFESNAFLSNILISVYSRYGLLEYARVLFDHMSERNFVTWSSMIAVFSQNGCHEEALIVFSEFQRCSGDNPNEFILASVIRACTQLGIEGNGAQLHGFVVKSGFDQDVYVGTALVDFYAKNGEVEQARLVFDGLLVRSAVTWTTMIAGYMKIGRSEVSLELFEQMKETDIVPDRYILCSILSACASLEFLIGGKQVHAYVLTRGMDMDVSVSNVLIDLYVKCGKVRTGQKLFDQMEVKNVISWTTMISGYMQNAFDWEAMKLFADMNRFGGKPDGFACTSVLTSCGSIEAFEQGRQVHAYAIKTNLDSDEFVNNGLIDMYCKCNSLTDARRSFLLIKDHGVISYNAMIEGYSRQDKLYEALELFCQMRINSVQPSLLTFISLLGVSASLLALELSKQIHSLIVKFGVSLDIFAGSALIDVYSKCSLVEDARLVFEEIEEKDIVVWNALFFGYTQQLESGKALKLYSELQCSRQEPNEFTFVAILTAASNLASLPHGEQFHNQLIKKSQDFDPFVTNALVDMYAKCGSIEAARKMFDSTIWKDIVCWNSMIATYAQHGEAENALNIFEGMTEELQPTYVTFIGVLSACAHVGLVEDGIRYFDLMPVLGIEAGAEHYACIVSLLGRAGKLCEAVEFIEKMPIQPTSIVWRSLLSACRMVGNVELARYAAEMAILIDPKDSGSYILLSNAFASKGMWADVKKVRQRMEYNGVVKEAGCSWIELNNEVHAFIAKDKTHDTAELIYSTMDYLIQHMRALGYVPDTATLSVDD